MYRHEVVKDEFDYALSPIREAAAYEALWDNENASVKKIAEKVIHHQRYYNLSSLIEVDKIEEYIKILLPLLSKVNNKFGVRFLGEADYPNKLLDAKYPVPLLYYVGNWDLIFSPSVAIVGTRRPTFDGIKRTKQLVKYLVEDDFTIVSGLAAGIDTAAHEAAIAQNGRTIAVIGTPVVDQYPKENKKLQDKISTEHLLISQVPFIKYNHQNYLKNRFFFPERNKTMSALTLATIIVEAGETSGSLIQAKAALEQGRKLFILDNCFQNKELTWPAKYQEKGAVRVHTYEDIRNHLKAIKNEPQNEAFKM